LAAAAHCRQPLPSVATLRCPLAERLVFIQMVFV
jgi:hypothetical protein